MIETERMLTISCVQLFVDPMDCSPPGFSVHGIFQGRILEWDAKIQLQDVYFQAELLNLFYVSISS